MKKQSVLIGPSPASKSVGEISLIHDSQIMSFPLSMQLNFVLTAKRQCQLNLCSACQPEIALPQLTHNSIFTDRVRGFMCAWAVESLPSVSSRERAWIQVFVVLSCKCGHALLLRSWACPVRVCGGWCCHQVLFSRRGHPPPPSPQHIPDCLHLPGSTRDLGGSWGKEFCVMRRATFWKEGEIFILPRVLYLLLSFQSLTKQPVNYIITLTCKKSKPVLQRNSWLFSKLSETSFCCG